METKDIINQIKKAKENGPKRKFLQKLDFIVNLKDLDFKRPENHVDFFIQLHYSIGKKVKVCALVGPELESEAKNVCENTITQIEFDKFKEDKRAAKKLADDYDYFIAQANIMPQVAQVFGKIFGPRNKMPNPKAGCVVPPKASLGPLLEKLHQTVRVKAKKDPMVQLMVGNEEMKDEEIADNIKTIYNQIIHHLPNEMNNIKSAYIKLTMGKPIKVV